VIYLLVSDDSLLQSIVCEALLPGEIWSWAGRRRNGEASAGPGQGFYGDPTDPQTFRQVPRGDSVALVCLRDREDAPRIVRALLESRPDMKILLATETETTDPARDNVRRVSWADLLGNGIELEVARLRTNERVRAVREVLDSAASVALLLQPDPDPDGIASALALRSVLRRNRATAPIVAFGGVTRPENVAMLRLLEIDLEVVRPDALGRYDRIALLDVQPGVFREALRPIDVVIDHHPEEKGLSARFRDIRASYGATSTMLTEYCLAAGMNIPQRLATALLYGIKTDTLFLDRETSKADIAAFAYLYPRVNANILRRVEKPELPRSAFTAFSRALKDLDLSQGLAYVHLGVVDREDVIPQMAELCLQLEGAEWSAASGVVDGHVVVSVRNGGYQKAAGGVVKSLFGDIGCAGGHQAMAKAVISKDAFRRKFGSTRPSRIRTVMVEGFLSEIG